MAKKRWRLSDVCEARAEDGVMTRDDAIARARAVVCEGCADEDRGLLREMFREVLEAYDEARSELDHMRQGYDRVRADRDYHCDRAIAAVAERDALAAQLAALREAARLCADAFDDIAVPRSECAARNRALRATLTDTEAAAEAHDRRVRAEALREAAADLRDRQSLMTGWAECRADSARWLVGRAGEIERGAR